MPKKPIVFDNLIIYKIVPKDTSKKDCYIDMTTDFRKRKHHHKSASTNENNKFKNHKIHQHISNNGGWNDFEMIMIEKYPCKDSMEGNARKRYWIEQLSPNLN